MKAEGRHRDNAQADYELKTPINTLFRAEFWPEERGCLPHDLRNSLFQKLITDTNRLIGKPNAP